MESCFIDIEEYKYEYQMTIARFSERVEWTSLDNASKQISSSKFTTGVDNLITWNLSVVLPQPYHDQDRIIFKLIYCQSDHAVLRSALSVYILNVKGQRVKIKPINQNYNYNDVVYPRPTGKDAIILSISHPKKDILEKAHLYLPNDQLTIIAKISIKADIIDKIQDKSLVNHEGMNDIAKLFNDKESSDVHITTGGKKFFVHKFMLCARSAMFAALLKNECLGTAKKLTLPNVNASIGEKMLQYIYTDSVDGLKASAMDLLVVADEYQLPGLKAMCERSLRESLTIDNSAMCFILANRHNARGLLTQTQKFIDLHIADVMKTSGYKVMEKEYPQLAMMINDTHDMKADNVNKKLVEN